MKNFFTKSIANVEEYMTGKLGRKFTLRDWQSEAFKQIDAFQAGCDEYVGLCDATCGAGKSTVQAIQIDAEANALEEKGEHGVFLLASHRLSLNAQLIEGCYEKIKDFNKRFVIRTLSSDDTYEKFDTAFIQALRGGLVDTLKKKHVLIIACDMSLNEDNKDDDGLILKMANKLSNLRSKETGFKINLAIVDECHKDIKKTTLEKMKKLCKKIMLFSATPTRANQKLANFTVSYNFKQANADGVVVAPKLFTIPADELNRQHKCNITIAALKHLIDDVKYSNQLGKKANLCVFNNGVDDLPDIAASLKQYFGDKIDIATFACYKDITLKDDFGIIVGKTTIQNTFNEEINFANDAELRKRCAESKKPLVILSAYKLQEGIDMKYLNGVLILCDKNDASLYQAICRGDRADGMKKRFNLYTPSLMIERPYGFLNQLVAGFDDTLNYGDGEDPESHSGSDNKEDIDTSILPPVEAVAVNYEELVVEARRNYTEVHATELIIEDFMNKAKKLYNANRPIGEVWVMFADDKYITLSDENRNLIDEQVEKLYN